MYGYILLTLNKKSTISSAKWFILEQQRIVIGDMQANGEPGARVMFFYRGKEDFRGAVINK